MVKLGKKRAQICRKFWQGALYAMLRSIRLLNIQGSTRCRKVIHYSEICPFSLAFLGAVL